MELNKLISKYLDGELSRSEDVELRKLLSKDLVAKETFDAYVMVHAAMKEDAKTIVPSAELVSETEDLVLSKIFTEQAVAGTIVPKTKNRKVFTYLSVAALFLLFSVVAINDFSYNLPKQDISQKLQQDRINILHLDNLEQIGISDELIAEPETLSMDSPDVQSSVANDNLLATADKSNIRVANNVLYGSGASSGLVMKQQIDVKQFHSESEANSTVPTDVDNIAIDVPIVKPSDIYLSGFEIEELPTDVVKTNSANGIDATDIYLLDSRAPVSTINMELINPNMRTIANPANIPDEQWNNSFYGKRSDIQLTTFLGTAVFQGGFDSETPEILANFSQSIAYKVNDAQQFGIDIGFSQYSFDRTKNVRLPGIIINDDDGNNSSAYYTPTNSVEVKKAGNPDNYIETSIKINTYEQMFWSAGFFDQRILNSNRFTLNGRLGLGGTNNGPLAYLRFYAKYNLFSWLSINAGTDGRLFRWSEPAFGANSSDFKSSISFIYGFAIKI